MDGPEGDAWRADFDVISTEARQALPRARYVPEQRDTAYRVSLLLAELSFARGRPGESQRRYELAAELAPDDAARAAALRHGRGSGGGAAVRQRGAAPAGRWPPRPRSGPATGSAPRWTWPARPS